MEKAVQEALSLILGKWVDETKGQTFELLTDDVAGSKRMFCTCLDRYAIKYQIVEDKLIIGNNKICIYDKVEHHL